MNQETKTKWIEALSSGQYVKGDGRLCYLDKGSTILKHCCLGVLCEISPGVIKRQVSFVHFGFCYKDREFSYVGTSFPPKTLTEELKLSNLDIQRLIALNDENDSWDPVIEYIENIKND